MRHIHISAIIGSTLPVETQFQIFHETGFDGVFATFTGTEPVEEWARAAAKYKLEFEAVQGSFQQANLLWEGGMAGREYLKLLKYKLIDTCSRIGVGKCVMHVTAGNTAPEISGESLSLFRDLCDYAASEHVQVCFENMELPVHLDSVMEHITDPFHGFCWDCGHNACYTPHIDMMEKFGSRLKCVHLHDNFGVTRPGNIDRRDDRHLLPFDGVLDWNWVCDKLNSCHYDGPVTLELSIQGKPLYQQTPFCDYAAEAYSRACMIRDKLAKIKS